jgi:hypothetical protein
MAITIDDFEIDPQTKLVLGVTLERIRVSRWNSPEPASAIRITSDKHISNGLPSRRGGERLRACPAFEHRLDRRLRQYQSGDYHDSGESRDMILHDTGAKIPSPFQLSFVPGRYRSRPRQCLRKRAGAISGPLFAALLLAAERF